MRRMIYLDAESEGLAPSTSHPRFVALAPESFYDEADDMAPFGSDEGSDTLRMMERWYTEHGEHADPIAFLDNLLATWGFDVPAQMADASDQQILGWLAEDHMNESVIVSQAQARIAVALGQLKITGAISPAALAEGRRGVRVMRVITTSAHRDLDGPDRDRALAALDAIARVLAGAA